MAKRRRVGNLLALAVLAALVERPRHPYEIAAVLRARGKDQDMPIKWGSLYTVVANLERHGLVAAVESARQGRRPERTVYRLTEAGHAELVDWTRELVAVPEREQPRFEAGLSVLGVLAPDEALDLLRQRLDRLKGQLAAQRAALAGHAREVPRIFLIEAEYDLAVREAEATWVRGLLDELTTGALPGLAEWRAWHETGAVPPEWAALAERGTEPHRDPAALAERGAEPHRDPAALAERGAEPHRDPAALAERGAEPHRDPAALAERGTEPH